MTKRKLSDFELNKENPFAKQALVNIGSALVSNQLREQIKMNQPF